jgi:hypothetical protein
MTRRYFALQDFFLGYFHPDWQLDASDSSEVVEAFLASADPEQVKKVLIDLRELLSESRNETELHDAVLNDYSVFYDPWKENVTMRDWLEGLSKDLSRDERD